MPKSRKRKRSPRTPKPGRDPEALSGWTVETKVFEPVRLRPISATLWRETLIRLRDDFLSTRKEHGPLRCPLFQNSTSKADPTEPPYGWDLNYVAFRNACYRGFRQYVSADGKPLYLKHPIVDVEGKPIVDGEGRGIMCAMPAGREWRYAGTSAASGRFVELAERAGTALLGSPRPAIASILLDTLLARQDEYRWVWSVFELAWQGRHPSLRAERRTWFRPIEPIPDLESEAVVVPYDRAQLRSMRSMRASVAKFPEEWTERLPGYFVSELPDLFQASADLIDTLLDIGTRCETNDPLAPASGQSKVAPETSMSAFDRQVLCTLTKMARGIEIEIPRCDQMDPKDVRTRPDEMFPDGNVTVSRTLALQMPMHENEDGSCTEHGQALHLIRSVPYIRLEAEFPDSRAALRGTLIALEDRGLIVWRSMDLALPVGRSTFVTSRGTRWHIDVERNENDHPVGRFVLKAGCEADNALTEVGSRMRWYTPTPSGWDVAHTDPDRRTSDTPASAADGQGAGHVPSKRPVSTSRSEEAQAAPDGVDPSKPDATGYVANPSDPSPYVPLATIRAEHCEDIDVTTVKDIVRIIENFTTYHVRWTRPLTRGGRPNPRRRNVHLADWLGHVGRLKGQLPSSRGPGFRNPSPDEIDARKAQVRRTRRPGK